MSNFRESAQTLTHVRVFLVVRVAQQDVNVRSAAFTLFAELCRFGHAETKAGSSATGLGLADADLQSNFVDQVHTFLPVFMVHCNDEDKTVSRVSQLGCSLARSLTQLLKPFL